MFVFFDFVKPRYYLSGLSLYNKKENIASLAITLTMLIKIIKEHFYYQCGSIADVTEARAAYLINMGIAEIVKEKVSVSFTTEKKEIKGPVTKKSR